ncbi:hypothetical protein Rsub_02942 [Raphidocelis subcapitata]|uniref:Calcineurin-like phosphoesterase domain-containing protein n=1 Tax=Raphidocelis subcapitata TaxID=307507 RepID=A0A2V0NSY0_9CHLO|nr:hypothetical protein Rsub_02942 [Raphidocelis subcapitata]|eukprot:GBF89772.1 hypothetical protein Rsub_02942 [Raphidocelis subcapitata]
MERIPIDDDEDAEDREFLHGFDRIEQRVAARDAGEKRRRVMKIAAVVAAACVLVVLVGALGAGARKLRDAPYQCAAPDGQYNVTFFVIGDWGRQGNGNQLRAARMMADVAACAKPNFIISSGDNFYSHGLTSANDPAFEESFSKVYSASSIKEVPWYAVLGNHDYNDGIDPAANSACAAANDVRACPSGCCYSSTWEFTGARNDARWHLANGTWAVPGLPSGLLEIFMVDTNPFITRYLPESWSANAGGSNVRPGEPEKYQANPGWQLPFFADDQGFASVRLNATHARIDLYTSNRAGPAASRTLVAGAGGAAVLQAGAAAVQAAGAAAPSQPAQAAAQPQPQAQDPSGSLGQGRRRRRRRLLGGSSGGGGSAGAA